MRHPFDVHDVFNPALRSGSAESERLATEGDPATTSVPQAPAEVELRRRASGSLRSPLAWTLAGAAILAVVGLAIARTPGGPSPARALAPQLGATSSVPPASAGTAKSGGGLAPAASGRSGQAQALAPGTGGISSIRSPVGDSNSTRGDFGNPGASGTVVTVGTNHFTVIDRSGQTVAVKEQSSTVYVDGSTSAASGAIVPGLRVRVEGTRTGNTVLATRVVVRVAGSFGGEQSH